MTPTSPLDTAAEMPVVVFGALAAPIPPARQIDFRRIDSPHVTAMIVEYEREMLSGWWYSKQVHYFDMSLTLRSSAMRGCFEEVFQDPLPIGKLCFIPAGYRMYGEGPRCRQRNLKVFVRAPPLRLPDIDARHLEPMLRECIRFGNKQIREALERIASELCAPDFASARIIEGLGLALVAEAARALRLSLLKTTQKGGLPVWRQQIIDERVRSGDPLPSVKELAALCGLSARQMMRVFQEQTGGTLGAYLKELTNKRAQTLLVDTDLPISNIARKVGFGSASAFSIAFRRDSGETPRSFRARRRRSVRIREPAMLAD